MKDYENHPEYSEPMEDIGLEYEEDVDYGTESIEMDFMDDDDDDFDESAEFAESDDFDDDFDEGVYDEFDEDEYESASEMNPEFLGAIGSLGSVLAPGIGSAIKGIRSLTRKKGRSRRSTRSYAPKGYLKHRTGSGRVNLSGRSNLGATIKTRSGYATVKLPGNVATKADVSKLAGAYKRDVKRNSTAIRRNASAIRKNLAAARKLNADLKVLDKKHSKISERQTKVISSLDRKINALRKLQEEEKQKAQQQAMMSMFMQPELEKITMKKTADGSDGNEIYTVQDSEFETNMLPLLMGMGMSGSGSKDGMNPMMMMLLMDAMDNDD